MEASKVSGVYYFEYPERKEKSHDGVEKVIPERTPQIPPWTTWSGLLHVPPDSPYAKRLVDKCGGVPLKKKGGDIPGKEGWLSGFWTAPKHWPDMSAGRESPRPFSNTTHAARDFPFISV